METKYIPEFVLYRRKCQECGSSIIEISEPKKEPYFCKKCNT